jgi:spermidine/putrescine-binding protein
MKQIHLLTIVFATYHISSFSSEHQLNPTQKAMFNETVMAVHKNSKNNDQKTMDYYIMIERENYETNHQKIVNYYNRFPKISQEKLDAQVAQNEREIKENQAKYKKEQEQKEIQSSVQYCRRNQHQRRL